MNVILDLFIFGSFWFWFLSSIIFVLMIILAENETGFWPTVLMIGTIVLMHFANNGIIFSWINTNPWSFLIYVFLYFLIGVVWSFIKWYFYLANKRDEIKEDIKNNSNIDYHLTRFDSTLDATYNKRNIIRWMSYWPFSLIWTLMNDPIRKMFKIIYTYFSNLYQKMSNHMFKNVKIELENKKDENYQKRQAKKERKEENLS